MKARRKWFSKKNNKQQRQLFMRYHHSQPKTGKIIMVKLNEKNQQKMEEYNCSWQRGTLLQDQVTNIVCYSEARCPACRMLVNARVWRNNASWSGVAYTTSGSKARSNARWRGRSLAFKTRWRMCFSYKSFTFICFHANFSSFSFVDRQNTYSCKSDLFAN